MKLLTHGPNCILDYVGACLVVVKLTESLICPLCFRLKDRSRMVLYYCDLCGIIATGDILSFAGVLPLMSPYRTTLEYPFLIFSAVSACRTAMAADEFSNGCGP